LHPREAGRLLARRLGYEVRQFTPLRSLVAARRELFERRAIDVVIDVGANAGQYGELLRHEGFAGRLVSLEPVAEAYEALRRVAEADGAWTALRIAASDADGEVTLHVTEDTRSASVLARNQRFAGRPGWGPRADERVPARRLDGLLGELIRAGERPYLKLDVQGYERQVIEGAGDALGRFEGLELELSVLALYDGQTSLAEMLPLLAERGFRPVSLEPILLDDDGLLVELDGVFARA
jgi:FkbM family methyltransferase